MKIPFSYLKQKFTRETYEKITDKMWDDVVADGDFTLGKAVTEFEHQFAELIGSRHAIGVANGTDAIRIALRVLGVGPGDEVICPANTFIASLGAVDELFAKPVLVDMSPYYVMDVGQIEASITAKTKAIVAVHFTGEMCEMDQLMMLSEKYKIPVVEDTAQGVLATFNGKCAGTFGAFGTFSLHPLKNLNVMGDGGMITTQDDELARKVRLYRNHGLFDRDTVESFGCNSRLDSLQAVVGNTLIKETRDTVNRRRVNAHYYITQLAGVKGVTIRHERRPYVNSSYHLFFIEVDRSVRDALYNFMIDNGIEVKIHYKTPLYLQPGLKHLGHVKGDFPMADVQCDRIITLKIDEHTTTEQQDYVVDTIKKFFESI